MPTFNIQINFCNLFQWSGKKGTEEKKKGKEKCIQLQLKGYLKDVSMLCRYVANHVQSNPSCTNRTYLKKATYHVSVTFS